MLIPKVPVVIKRRTRHMRIVGVLLVVVGLTVAGSAATVGSSASVQANAAVPFASGDVLVGIGAGQINHFSPTGTLKNTLQSPSTSTENTGMAFDPAGNLYATEFQANAVRKYDSSGVYTSDFGSGFNADPESIVRDAAGNFYVGQADGTADVLKFDSSGNPVGSFDVATENRGSDWIDLAADQCTLYYTSEGPSVKRFNVCTNTQLSDFATGLTGESFALRVRPDNSGEVIVANTDAVLRLDSSGIILKSYTPPGATFLFAANLDPDGTSFWTADYSSGSIWKIDIATGNILQSFTTNVNVTVAGLAVVGELTAAAKNLDVTVVGAGSVTSNPSGITCPTTCSASFAAGTSVALTATPTGGATFTGWSGDCTGTGACTVTMNADHAVTATFTTVVSPTLTVVRAGTGSGSVTSSPAGISCPSTCSASFTSGTSVALTATADEGSTFAGWSGACSGTGSCNVVMTGDKSVTATFTPIASGSLSITSSVSPAEITAGSIAKTHFTIKNTGISRLNGVSALVTLPGGATPISITPSSGTCSPFSGGQSTCTFGRITAGGTRGIDVLARSAPSSRGPFLTTVDATADGGAQAMGIAGPNVVAPTPGTAVGFVPPGGSISTGTNPTPANNTVGTFSLPNTGSGAPITLRAEPNAPGLLCGGSPCLEKTLFLSPFTGYTDPRHPAVWKIVWDASVLPNGLRTKVYVQKQENGPNVLVPDCRGKRHNADPHPCLADVERRDGGDIEFEILLLSGDPKGSHR